MSNPDVAFDEFAALPRWVTWNTELRNGKLNKTPFDPHTNQMARSNDPATWGTREAAEKAFHQLGPSLHGPGGVGIMLGELGDGRVLGGVDLDTCRDPDTGALEPWAREVIACAGSYTEVSPSGTGVKIFLTFDAAILPELREHMGSDHGRTWKRPGGAHPPAIELHLSGRYFTVTDDHLPDTPAEVQHVPADVLLWVIQQAGPAFVDVNGTECEKPEKGGDGAKKADDRTPEHSEAEDIDPLVEARLRDALTRDARLAQRWNGDTAGLRDASRSSLAFALGGMLRDAGFGFGDMCALLRINEHTGAWASEKGADGGERELQRIWDRAGKRRRGESPRSEAAGDDRPLIRVSAGDLKSIVDAAEQALIDAKLGVYQRSGCIVRPAMMRVNVGEDEKNGTAVTQRIVEVGNYARRRFSASPPGGSGSTLAPGSGPRSTYR